MAIFDFAKWHMDLQQLNPLTARLENIIHSQSMGNSLYHRQHYTTYHGYKYSLPSVAGFIRQSWIIIYFLRRKYPAGQAAKGLNTKYFTMCTVV